MIGVGEAIEMLMKFPNPRLNGFGSSVWPGSRFGLGLRFRGFAFFLMSLTDGSVFMPSAYLGCLRLELEEREAVEPLLNPLRELLVAIDAVVKTVLVSSTIITFIQFTVAET